MFRVFLSVLLALVLAASSGMASGIFTTTPPEGNASQETAQTASPDITPLPEGTGTSGQSGVQGGIGHISSGSSGNQLTSAPTPMPVELTPVESIPTAEKKAWTVMVYLCGSNLESGSASASRDLVEMASAGFDESQINVVALTGGSALWGLSFIPSQALTLLEVHRDTVYRTGMFELASMGQADTLSNFLKVTHDHYPADHYALILWNHGGGPNQGVCVDELFEGDRILIPELVSALKDSPFASRPLDWIGFDACLMGSLEIADALHPYAGYLVASEEVEPALGWNYEMLRGLEKDKTAEDTGRRIVDTYFAGLAPYQSHLDGIQTLSVVNLAKVDTLKEALGNLFEELSAALTRESFAQLARARESTIPFGHTDNPIKYLDYDLLDLKNFISQLPFVSDASRSAVLSALDNAVVYSKSNARDIGGLSLYHPYYSGIYYRYFEDVYTKMAPSRSYTEYIGQFLDYMTGESQTDWSGMSTLGHISKDIRSQFSLKLTPSQRQYLAEILLRVYQKDPESGAYSLVAVVPDVEIDDEGVASAEYAHRALFVVDGEGNPVSGALPYTVLESGRYGVEAVLIQSTDGGGEIRRNVRLVYDLESRDGTLSLVSIEGQDAFTGAYTARMSLNLEDFARMEFLRETRNPVQAAEGILAGYENWETVSTESISVDLTKPWNLMMLHQQLDPATLHVSFAIRDLQNGLYASSLVSLEKIPGPTTDPDSVVLTYGTEGEDYLSMDGFKLTRRENGSMILAFRATSLTDTECIVQVRNLRINGIAVDAEADIYGSGAHDGLTKGEEQPLMLMIPADAVSGIETVKTVEFDMRLVNAETEEEIVTLPASARMQ